MFVAFVAVAILVNF